VRIATHVVIIPANHVFTNPDLPICRQGLTCKGVTIEDDVWIGCNVTVLDGAHIGRGSVIAAGSVVRGRVEPWSVMGGVPARVIKMRKTSD
jgi:acetyltransferase-like isoleucine patch superfamily enzyme